MRALAGPTVAPIDRFLDQLKAVPFIKRAAFGSRNDDAPFDGVVTIRTEQELFSLPVELKLSYLDRASTNAISALAARSKREGHPLLLLARYIPRPTGERLAEADVNFIDLAGNMHLSLGEKYARTVLGRTEVQRQEQKRVVTAAQMQLLFLFAAEPDSMAWSVRRIAAQAGISKSKAAQVRQQLLADSVEGPAGKDRHLPSRNLEDRLLKGYAEVLRPKLVLGRFRYPDAKIEDFLTRLSADLAPAGVQFSLTGGPAAELLQHFYRGSEIPLFIDQWNAETQKRLRLLPDRRGSLTVMRAFGSPVFWRAVGPLTVAHPWLIYAELMNSDDPRAHEAAEELRKEFLPA